MLVKGQGAVIGILLVIFAEPVVEPIGDATELLTHLAAGNGGAAAARIVGDDVGKARIQHARHQGGLAQAGVTDHGGASGVQTALGHRVVQKAHICPRPHGDLAEGLGAAMLGIGDHRRRKSVGKIIVVGGHVIVTYRNEGKAAVDDLLGGTVFVVNSRFKIAMDEKGDLIPILGDRRRKGEGKGLAAHGSARDQILQIRLSRAKVSHLLGFRYLLKIQLRGGRQRGAVLLAAKQLNIFPAQLFPALCIRGRNSRHASLL